jgi:hypothetical protein
MLCGEHEVIDAYPGLVNDILSGLFYGVVECDAQVHEGLKDYFAEMAPIFNHSDISYENVSEDTKTQVKENYKSQKLIGSLHAQKMAFHTELLNGIYKRALLFPTSHWLSDIKKLNHSRISCSRLQNPDERVMWLLNTN